LSNLTDEEDFILGTMLGYVRRTGANSLEKADRKSISLSLTEVIGVVG